MSRERDRLYGDLDEKPEKSSESEKNTDNSENDDNSTNELSDGSNSENKGENDGLNSSHDDSKKPSGDKDQKSLSEKLKDPKERRKMQMKLSAAKTGAKGGEFYLKFLLLRKLYELLQMFANMVSQAIMSAINGIIGFVQGVIGFMINTFGLTGAAAATIMFGGLAGLSLVLGLVAATVLGGENVATYDSRYNACLEMQRKAKAGAIMDIDATGEKVKNAKLIYAFFHQLGMSDANIAGILGNFDAESGIDPTCVEGIYGGADAYAYGPRDQKAEEADFIGRIFNPNLKGRNRKTGKMEIYWDLYPNIYRVGIGLGQWTDIRSEKSGGRHTMLRKFAKANNSVWYDLGTQLQFMIADRSKGGDTRSNILQKYMAQKDLTPEDAALEFAHKWEGNTKLAQGERTQKARGWYDEIQKWTVEDDIMKQADTLIGQLGTLNGMAFDIGLKKKQNDCEKFFSFGDNSSIADAAVAIAYPTTAEATGNDGTALYREVKSKVIPGDYLFQSCDRTVCTAIRWSGADDNFPYQGVISIRDYVTTSPKWKEVPHKYGSTDDMQPGDLLLCKEPPKHSHVMIYVGNEAIRKKYPNAPANYCIVDGSLNTRSPGCKPFTEMGSGYRVFRNVSPEANSKYKKVVAGGALSVSKKIQNDLKAEKRRNLIEDNRWSSSNPKKKHVIDKENKSTPKNIDMDFRDHDGSLHDMTIMDGENRGKLNMDYYHVDPDTGELVFDDPQDQKDDENDE